MLKKKHFFSAPAAYTLCFWSHDANHMFQPDNVSPTTTAHAPPATRHTCYLSSSVHGRFGARDSGPPSLPPSRLLFPSQDLLTQCLADYLQQSCEAWQQISCAREREKTTAQAGWHGPGLNFPICLASPQDGLLIFQTWVVAKVAF